MIISPSCSSWRGRRRRQGGRGRRRRVFRLNLVHVVQGGAVAAAPCQRRQEEIVAETGAPPALARCQDREEIRDREARAEVELGKPHHRLAGVPRGEAIRGQRSDEVARPAVDIPEAQQRGDVEGFEDAPRQLDRQVVEGADTGHGGRREETPECQAAEAHPSFAFLGPFVNKIRQSTQLAGRQGGRRFRVLGGLLGVFVITQLHVARYWNFLLNIAVLTSTLWLQLAIRVIRSIIFNHQIERLS